MYNLFMRQEERLRAEVRKWGHSLGVILPKPITRKLELKEHETVELKIKKRGGQEDLMELFGAARLKESTAKIKKELKEGWDD